MTRPPSRSALLLAAAATLGPLAARPAAAQDSPFGSLAAIAGVESRRYAIDSANLRIRTIEQYAVPLAVVIPIDERFTVDIGTAWARTKARRESGPGGTLEHITDTQVRASYVFGQDALVASVMVNLPTGPETATLADQTVANSVASTFLSFPVNAYATGTSVTGGLAAAMRAGSWNLGAAGSLRLNAKYEPFANAPVPIEYRPGLEARLRLGADRLIGASRLQLGVTVSTFGTDQFSGGTTVTGEYRPGHRLIGEASLVAPIGRGTLTLYAWDYFRAAGDTATRSTANRENVFTGGMAASLPIARQVSLEPLVEARLWAPQRGNGHLLGAGLGVRVGLGNHLALSPSGRYDTGSFQTPAGNDFEVDGWAASVLLRYEL